MPRWPDPEDRFWSYVDRRGPDECWNWTGPVDSEGYGQIYWEGRLVGAARLMLMFQGEDLAEGVCALHTCDNPPCINPRHLFPGTKKVNSDDMKAKGRERKALGTANCKARLNDRLIHEIRSTGEGTCLLARRLGVNRTTIQRARRGRSWKHVDAAPAAPIVDPS